MNALSNAIREKAEQLQDAGDVDASSLLRVLASIVDGSPVPKAFGAPGEWGYGRPLGDGLLAFLKHPRGIDFLAIERRDQLREHRFGADRDAQYVKGELAQAAASYAILAALQAEHGTLPPCFIPKQWPWDRAGWKPSISPIHNLAKSGALAAAEIDRRLAISAKTI